MRTMLAAFGCGLLAVLSQPPVSVPWVLFIAIPGLFILWSRAQVPRRAFAVGWAGGVGYFGGGLHWIVEPFLVDAATFGWMIPFALFGIATGLALFWGAGFWLAKQIASAGWAAPLMLSVCWIAMEWLRGNILTGFPWGLLGYAWIETPVMQSAAWVGIYGVTLGTVLTGAIIGAALLAPHRLQQFVAVFGTIIFLAVVWVDGRARLAGFVEPGVVQPMIGLIQPNVAQKDKWQPGLREPQLADLLEKTRELSDSGADVIVWPEAASPYPVDPSPRLRAMIAATMKPGVVVLAGGLRFEGRGTPDQKVYNSLVAVDAKGDLLGTYDKRHLVPFGEYLPFDSLLTRMGLRALVTLPGGMSSGHETGRRMEVAGLPPFVPMICYEAIFPAEIMARNAGVDWLVQVTNDAWFGRHVGPYQHLVQARVRAIERGLPMVRAANTGISAIVDAQGRIRVHLPLNEAGVLIGRLPEPGGKTLYAGFEDIPFGLLVVILGALGCLRRSRRLPAG